MVLDWPANIVPKFMPDVILPAPVIGTPSIKRLP